MKRKSTLLSNRITLPEEELRDLSFTEDLSENFNPERNIHSKWSIEPWKNQHENPSESPERKLFLQKFPMVIQKQEKLLNLKLRRLSTNVLESMNDSFVINRPKISKRNQSQEEIKDQEENRSVSRALSFRRKSSTQRSTCQNYIREKEEIEDYSLFQTKINPISYPVITDMKKKRLLKKMDKFENFVSVTLRK